MDAIRKIESAFDAEFICYEFPSEQQRDTAMTMFRLGYRAGSASKEAELVRLRGALERIEARCPACSSIYTIGSVGDIARAALEGELQRRDARILALEKMLACPSCGGSGWHSTGIDESPTTPCGKCDGSGLATHAPAPVGAGGSVGADVVHLVRWSYEDAARMVEQEDPRTSDWMWDDRNDLANAIHRRCEETIQGLATTTPEQGDATPAQSVPLGGGEVPMSQAVREFVGEVADDTMLNNELRAWAKRLIAEDDAASRVPVASPAEHEPDLLRNMLQTLGFDPEQPQQISTVLARMYAAVGAGGAGVMDARPDSVHSDSGECGRVQGLGPTDAPRWQVGVWTLTAPDGRTWSADSPLKACSAEQRDRIPPEVALKRIFDACDDDHDWQPIETAPKDGTRVILSWGGKSINGFYLDNSRTSTPWAGWRVESMVAQPAGRPTHWQTFPDALSDAAILAKGGDQGEGK